MSSKPLPSPDHAIPSSTSSAIFPALPPPVHEEVVVAPANANVLLFARLFRWELADRGVCLLRGDCDHPAALGSSLFALLFVGLFFHASGRWRICVVTITVQRHAVIYRSFFCVDSQSMVDSSVCSDDICRWWILAATVIIQRHAEVCMKVFFVTFPVHSVHFTLLLER